MKKQFRVQSYIPEIGYDKSDSMAIVYNPFAYYDVFTQNQAELMKNLLKNSQSNMEVEIFHL